jgi:hypothetical protein
VRVHVVNAKNNYNGKLTNRNATKETNTDEINTIKVGKPKKDKRLMAVCVLVFVAGTSIQNYSGEVYIISSALISNN